MELSEIAKKLYLEGYNCCESILLSLKEGNVISVPDEVLNIASCFRAGISGSGCVCGVITGGVMAIGLKYGSTSKKEVNRRAKIFYDKFRDKFKSTCCRVLTNNWKDNFNIQERKNFCAEIVAQMTVELQKLLE